jgi:hypothetical protein
LGINEERASALSLMATIDQLILFFFALKVCLSFSQLISKDLLLATDNNKSKTDSEEHHLSGSD